MHADAYTGEWASVAHEVVRRPGRLSRSGETSPVLTFARDEQVVGWPCFTIDAPAGTVVEILVHEAHKPRSQFSAQYAFQFAGAGLSAARERTGLRPSTLRASAGSSSSFATTTGR